MKIENWVKHDKYRGKCSNLGQVKWNNLNNEKRIMKNNEKWKKNCLKRAEKRINSGVDSLAEKSWELTTPK